jgi:RimJ/RimL family protein N-acetyltransferase
MRHRLEIPTERERISLRQMTAESDDLAWCLALRESYHPLLPDNPMSPDYKRFKYLPVSRQKFPGSRDFGIWDINEIRGIVSLYPEPGRLAEIMYSVAPQYTGGGIGEVAVKALVLHAAEFMPVDSIYAEIKPDNIASQKTIVRAGFALTGRQPDYLTYTFAPLAEAA